MSRHLRPLCAVHTVHSAATVVVLWLEVWGSAGAHKEDGEHEGFGPDGLSGDNLEHLSGRP